MKILIAYASKSGTTEDCAQSLAQQLDAEVTLLNLKKGSKVDFSVYSHIVIGTPLYMGKVMAPVQRFCRANLPQLLSKRLGFFTCGIGEEKEMQKYVAAAIPAELLQHAAVRKHFGGELRLEKLNFLMRFAMQKQLEQSNAVYQINRDAIEEFSRLLMADETPGDPLPS